MEGITKTVWNTNPQLSSARTDFRLHGRRTDSHDRLGESRGSPGQRDDDSPDIATSRGNGASAPLALRAPHVALPPGHRPPSARAVCGDGGGGGLRGLGDTLSHRAHGRRRAHLFRWRRGWGGRRRRRKKAAANCSMKSKPSSKIVKCNLNHFLCYHRSTHLFRVSVNVRAHVR